jgi:hypothetical protein
MSKLTNTLDKLKELKDRVETAVTTTPSAEEEESSREDFVVILFIRIP